MTNLTEKPTVEHVSGLDEDGFNITKVDGYQGYGHVKSRFDELSIPQTLWVFKRVIIITLAVYTGYVCEGFEVSKGHYPTCIGIDTRSETTMG